MGQHRITFKINMMLTLLNQIDFAELMGQQLIGVSIAIRLK
jgi:hypothetical protein